MFHSAVKVERVQKSIACLSLQELKCLLWETKLDIHTNNYVSSLMCAMGEYYVKNHKPILFPFICNNHT